MTSICVVVFVLSFLDASGTADRDRMDRREIVVEGGRERI
jgi:hypothetical protein